MESSAYDPHEKARKYLNDKGTALMPIITAIRFEAMLSISMWRAIDHHLLNVVVQCRCTSAQLLYAYS